MRRLINTESKDWKNPSPSVKACTRFACLGQPYLYSHSEGTHESAFSTSWLIGSLCGINTFAHREKQIKNIRGFVSRHSGIPSSKNKTKSWSLMILENSIHRLGLLLPYKARPGISKSRVWALPWGLRGSWETWIWVLQLTSSVPLKKLEFWQMRDWMR